MKVLDLFSGIGGFSLGLERAGAETVAFCEIDKKAQLVLKKHWPTVPIYEDIKELTFDRLIADGVPVPDLICGGFPCQDISLAGKGAGLAGERSGLWFEFHRLISEIRPKWVVAENVSALRSRGLDRVLRSLAEIGYDAEWHCIPASAVGASHRRDRIWIVAYPSRKGVEGSCPRVDLGTVGSWGWSSQEAVPHWPRVGSFRPGDDRWIVSALRGTDDGLPQCVDRLKQLGNAVVPQIPELIYRAILKADRSVNRI